MVIENLILPPRHASHRGSALLTIHPFSNLRVFRPLTRRLDRPPCPALQSYNHQLERERERERREKRRVVVVVGRKGGLRTQARSRVWPAPAYLVVFKAGQARNGGNARPTEPSSQRVASHRAQRPTRHVSPRSPANTLRCNREQPCFPLCQGLLCRRIASRLTEPSGQRAAPHRACRPTHPTPPSSPANAPRPTEPSGQRTPPHRACRPTRRAETGNSPASPFARGFCTGATPCFRRGHKAAPYIQLQLFLQLKSAPSPEVQAGLL